MREIFNNDVRSTLKYVETFYWKFNEGLLLFQSYLVTRSRYGGLQKRVTHNDGWSSAHINSFSNFLFNFYLDSFMFNLLWTNRYIFTLWQLCHTQYLISIFWTPKCCLKPLFQPIDHLLLSCHSSLLLERIVQENLLVVSKFKFVLLLECLLIREVLHTVHQPSI